MKINVVSFALLMLLSLAACQTDKRENTENENEEVNTKQETPVKMIEYLVGEWQLDAGANTGRSNQQGNADERLIFTQEARYIVRSGNQKTDSGAYRMNEQLKNLYLESEANEEPREYEIDLKQDVMTLKPKQGNKSQANGSYTYRRVGNASISPEERDE